jgi:hypothetical protein
MLLDAGYGCVTCNEEYVIYRKDKYVVTVMCGYPKTNNQVTNLYLNTVHSERILTTKDDSSYCYYKMPMETFLKIVLGTTSKIPMRVQNAINERILEDL